MIREKACLRHLKPYQTVDLPFVVKLDANEGQNILFPEGFAFSELALERYPDDKAERLVNKLADELNVSPDQIVEGNGSSELIELLIKTYAEVDSTILSFEPTFSMYRIYAEMHGARFASSSLRDDFSVDVEALLQMANALKPSLVFLCSPNNPTGGQMTRRDILRIVKAVDCLVVVDEAYIEFANRNESPLLDLCRYDNLVLLRTFSKAFGLAAIRLGYLIGPQPIVASLKKVKSPYHLNALTQTVGLAALSKLEIVRTHSASIRALRSTLANDLDLLGFQVFPSEANFLWVKSPIADLFDRLAKRGILIRRYGDPYHSYYRITIGTPIENRRLIQEIKEILDETNR
jgi:histidinol-phosphate aminotransferase